MRSIEASAGTSGRQMRLLTGQSSEFRVYSSLQTANRLTQGCSPNAMPVSPQDWLHDWLTRACMSCLAFSGPTPSSSSSPVAAWPAAQPRAAPAPMWAIPRRFGPLAFELCATRHERGFASSTGCSKKVSTNTPSDNAAAVYTSRTLEKSRTLQADSSENRERRSRPLRTFETVSVEAGFHIVRSGNAATQ